MAEPSCDSPEDLSGLTSKGVADPVHDDVEHPALARILRELDVLYKGGLRAELRHCPQRGPAGAAVVYYDVPVTSVGGAGAPIGSGNTVTTSMQDVVVPVPDGYPASAIDLAGLPTASALLPRLKGGNSPQGTLTVDGRQWTLASYHPHSNGGGRGWDPMVDGFHAYVDHLIAWLACQA